MSLSLSPLVFTFSYIIPETLCCSFLFVFALQALVIGEDTSQMLQWTAIIVGYYCLLFLLHVPCVTVHIVYFFTSNFTCEFATFWQILALFFSFIIYIIFFGQYNKRCRRRRIFFFVVVIYYMLTRRRSRRFSVLVLVLKCGNKHVLFHGQSCVLSLWLQQVLYAASSGSWFLTAALEQVLVALSTLLLSSTNSTSLTCYFSAVNTDRWTVVDTCCIWMCFWST